MKIGVLAGTPVDTRMGIEYFASKGEESFGIACSNSPKEQNDMQVLHKEELLRLSISHCLEMVKQGAQGICIYCNSLSAAIDVAQLKKEVPVPVITPLDIYRDSADKYSILSVIAANGNSLAGIERVVLGQNPNCKLFGAGLLHLVEAIENGEDADEIYERLYLRQLIESFEGMGCDALILGCTHFPYIEEQIKANLKVELINPNESMLQFLRDNQ